MLTVVGAGWLGGLGGCFRKKLAESWFIAFGVGVIGEGLRGFQPGLLQRLAGQHVSKVLTIWLSALL